MYGLIRPALFGLDPERAHALALASLDALAATPLASTALARRVPPSPVTAMGLSFPNRVGLAAGLDKNAAHIDGLAALGFGFIECGTVTPRAQPGNPPPRLFRIERAQALVNRMGFNNDGVERFVANVARARYRGILGLNIGRNFDTPNERAHDDYVAAFRAVYAHASYVAINVSSPNTKDLRALQAADALRALAGALKHVQARLAEAHGRYVPIAVKIAPDLDGNELATIARTLVDARIDGVIATNTTSDRRALAGLPHANETGGVSGAPLRERATETLRKLAKALDGALPIIGVGGILSARDALDKIAAGASLVQLYTGLVYRGPALVAEVGAALARA